MKIGVCLECKDFPCRDVRHESYIVPDVRVKPKDVWMVMISEAAPAVKNDYYYANGEPLFAKTTVQAFQDAGVKVKSIAELLRQGVYLTTAVKCGKIGYGISAQTVTECSLILEKELAQFPNVKVLMLMGDVAIKAVNTLAKRAGGKRVIPAGSTYKIRGGEFYFGKARAFPSYLQAGPSFFIEKSKRKMIAEDIKAAMKLRK